jgi:hypothetical protein
MKNFKKIALVVVTSILLVNCSSMKLLKFTDQENEIFPSENLKTFLKNNKSPKIVLRTSINKEEIIQGENKITQTDNNSYLYDAIEKELLKQGFTVRDRQLFNQVVSNKDNNVDYSKLKEKTDTDLIIELSKLDTKVLYETNKYYTAKGKDGLLQYIYKRYGATVEFKIIIMSNNEFAGTYKFNYSPCNSANPCEINEDFNKKWKNILKGKEAYEGVEKNDLENFIKNATKQLVESMRK